MVVVQLIEHTVTRLLRRLLRQPEQMVVHQRLRRRCGQERACRVGAARAAAAHAGRTAAAATVAVIDARIRTGGDPTDGGQLGGGERNQSIEAGADAILPVRFVVADVVVCW